MRNIEDCLGKSAGWDPDFSVSRKGTYFDAHKTWRDWYEEARNLGDDVEEDQELGTDPGDDDGESPSLIQEFMRGRQGSYICHWEATVVEDFCDSALLESLWAPEATSKDLLHHNTRNIWLAGSIGGNRGSLKLQPRWLTAQGFYDEFTMYVCLNPAGYLGKPQMLISLVAQWRSRCIEGQSS